MARIQKMRGELTSLLAILSPDSASKKEIVQSPDFRKGKAFEVAPALSYLATKMISNEEVAVYWDEDQPEKAQYEKNASQAKEILRKPFEYLYGQEIKEVPEAYLKEENKSYLNTRIISDLVHYNEASCQDTIDKVIPGSSTIIQEKYKKMLSDYPAILEEVDGELAHLRSRMNTRLWEDFRYSMKDGGHEPISFDNCSKLEVLNKEFYRLMVLREALHKKIFGKADVTKSEKKKINQHKADLEKDTDVDVKNQEVESISDKESAAEGLTLEKPTEENLEKYIKQKKEVFFDGRRWNDIEIDKDGNIQFASPRPIPEILKLAEGVVQSHRPGGEKEFMGGMVLGRRIAVTKNTFFSRAQWIIKSQPRSPDNPYRQKEVEAARELQRRVNTGEFDKNIGNTFVILNEAFKNEALRLNKEKEEFERGIRHET